MAEDRPGSIVETCRSGVLIRRGTVCGRSCSSLTSAESSAAAADVRHMRGPWSNQPTRWRRGARPQRRNGDDGSQCEEEKDPDKHGGATDGKERESRRRTGSRHVAQTGDARKGTPVSAGAEQGHLTRRARGIKLCRCPQWESLVPASRSRKAERSNPETSAARRQQESARSGDRGLAQASPARKAQRLYRAVQFALSQRHAIAIIVSLSLTMAVLNAIEPLVIKTAFDGLTAQREQMLLFSIIALGGLALVRELYEGAANWLTWRADSSTT